MRLTFETAGGTRIDIVSSFEDVVSGYFIVYRDLDVLLTRAKELGVPPNGPMPVAVFKVLVSENLVRRRVL